MTNVLDKVAYKADDTPPTAPEVLPEPAEEVEALSIEDVIANSLKELDMTPQDALNIIEAIFVDGEYRETFPVRGTLSVTFRTRTAAEEKRLKDELIRAGDVTIWERSYIIQMHNLATSLVSLGSHDMRHGVTDAEYAERKAFLMRQPNMLIDAIIRRLSTFDMKILVSCQDPILRDF